MNVSLIQNKKLAPWMVRLLEDGIQKAGSMNKLARRIGAAQSTANGWTSESVPGGEHINSLISYLGWDIEKAAPGAAPTAAERTIVYEDTPEHGGRFHQAPNTIFIAGQVSAGRVSFAGEDQHFKTFDSIWKESRYDGLTTGDIVYLEVHGESMLPDYKPGEIIACRQPSDQTQLPIGTPCIFQEGDEDNLTFKILRKTDTGVIIGQPLNPDFPMVMFKKNAVKIALVVLGKVQLEKRSLSQALSEAKPRRKTEKKQQ